MPVMMMQIPEDRMHAFKEKIRGLDGNDQRELGGIHQMIAAMRGGQHEDPLAAQARALTEQMRANTSGPMATQGALNRSNAEQRPQMANDNPYGSGIGAMAQEHMNAYAGGHTAGMLVPPVQQAQDPRLAQANQAVAPMMASMYGPPSVRGY